MNLIESTFVPGLKALSSDQPLSIESNIITVRRTRHKSYCPTMTVVLTLMKEDILSDSPKGIFLKREESNTREVRIGSLLARRNLNMRLLQ